MSRFSIKILPAQLAVFGVLLATWGAAQGWDSVGRYSGIVEDAGGDAVAEAQVSLQSVADPSVERVVSTDEQGRWSLSGLAPGAWKITIRAEGFDAAEGQVQVSGTSAPLRIGLRSLEEISPSGWEGNPLTVKSWLEKGNTLLEQGQTMAARAEFEKALRVLSDDARPEVLRVVARTHFLEQNGHAAIDALKLALVYGPEDQETQQLLFALAESQGRQVEIRTFADRLGHEPKSELLKELGVTGRPSAAGRRPLPESEWRPAKAHQTGRFRVRFENRSPLGLRDKILARHGIDDRTLGPEGARYDLAEESFEIHVPATYSPDRPAGLFVWVSPIEWGGFTRKSIREVLDREGMIWIGANASGNSRFRWDRISLALDAAFNMDDLYSLDENRVYVGGYSGGGRTASALTVLYPKVFRGGFFFMGVDFYRDVPALDRPGAHWPAAFPEPSAELFELARERSRYVLLTGEFDFNRIQTREFYSRYRDAGFRNVTLIVIPGASHYSGVSGDFLAQGFEALAPRKEKPAS